MTDAIINTKAEEFLAGQTQDQAGNIFSQDSCQITVVTDASGNVLSLTATDGINTWVQTVTYPDAVTTVYSKWVKQ